MPEYGTNLPRVVVLTAIRVEYQAVRTHLTNIHEEVHPQGTIYERGTFSSQDRSWDVVIGEIGAGNPGAALEAERAISHFKPQVILFVGVAGGVKDVHLGDVVVATKVYGYESGKAEAAFLTRPSVANSTYRMEQRARAEARKNDWLRQIRDVSSNVPPTAFVGPIAAGEKVIASTKSDVAKFVKEHYGDTLAVEMEGYGFLLAAHAYPQVEALVVRGISDRLDGKQEADAANMQQVAAQHASAFAFQVLATLDLARTEMPQVRRFPEAFPDVWNVPHRYNFLLTGRDQILKYLHDALFTLDESVSLLHPWAINGAGGMGKTQTATAYAFRYRRYYQAILWAKADTRSTLLADYRMIARLLHLPEENLRDDIALLDILMEWFRHNSEWLLILDNADDIALVEPFVPYAARGHILLTTRTQITNQLAAPIELERLSPEDGATYILKRGNILRQPQHLSSVPKEKVQVAEELADLVGGLPLALEQAGAYIDETQCGVSRYLKLYQERGEELRRLRGELTLDYLESIATTWNVSMKNLQTTCPPAVELLQLCAFLYPDAIPEDILTKGAVHLGPVLQPVAEDSLKLEHTIRELRKYSLIERDTDGHKDTSMYTIHRLVLDVQRDMMEQEAQHLWAERAVRAVCAVFLPLAASDRQQYQALLPHAQICANHVRQWNMTFAEAQLLLERLHE